MRTTALSHHSPSRKSSLRLHRQIVPPSLHLADSAASSVFRAVRLRGPVGRELNLQRAPELRFMHDASIDISAKLSAIVREDEERARAAGREPSAGGPSVQGDLAPQDAARDRSVHLGPEPATPPAAPVPSVAPEKKDPP